MSRAAVLSDREWARLEPLMPSSKNCPGRPFQDHRRILEGISYRYRVLSQADAAGLIEWEVSVDSTVNRAHQHGTNLPRTTGGTSELHESAHRAC